MRVRRIRSRFLQRSDCNNIHKLFGHLFSGRYKALVVEEKRGASHYCGELQESATEKAERRGWCAKGSPSRNGLRRNWPRGRTVTSRS